MADNYAALKTEVAQWVDREDLDEQIPMFIRDGEAMLCRGFVNARGNSQCLRVREMLMYSEIPLTDGRGDWPADFLEVDAITVDGEPGQMISQQEYMDKGATVSRYGRQFCVVDEGDSFLSTRGGISVRLRYFATFGGMSADSDTNSVLTAFPRLYRASAALSAQEYLQNPQQAQLELATVDRLTRGANAQFTRSRIYGGRVGIG